MKPSEVIAPIGGISGSRNEIVTPAGLVLDALNFVYTKPGIPERRRGFDVTTGNAKGLVSSLMGSPQTIFETNKSDLYLHKGIGLYADGGTSTQNWNHLFCDDGFQISPTAMCVKLSSFDGKVYFAQNSAIWVLDLGSCAVTLLAGLPGTTGAATGTGTTARFSASILGMCFDTASTLLYVCDTGNHCIRTVTTAGVVSALAGNPGVSGSANGTGAAGTFNNPRGIVAINSSNFYVCDYTNHTIRNVTTVGDVSTPYGLAGAPATTDANGTSSRFNNPSSICFDETNCYVSQPGTGHIRKIIVSTTAVSSPITGLSTPNGVAVKDSRLLVCQTGATNVRTYDTSGFTGANLLTSTELTSFIGNPYAIACDNGGYSPLGRWFIGGENGGLGLLQKHGSSFTSYATFDLIARANGTSSNPNAATALAGSVMAPDSSITWADGSDTFSGTGFGVRVRAADLARSTYVTSSVGVRKIDAVYSSQGATVARLAGVPRAVAPTLTLSAAGTPVLLANNFQRAYRIVWGRQDANGYIQIGAPCERVFVQNTSGATRDVSFAITIPPDVTSSDFYQIYATAIVSTATEPGDECALVRQAAPTSAEIADGSITYVDIAPDAVRGPLLYTNRSQEGIGSANERPPLARDLCEFRGHMLYADFTDKHRLFLQMIGVGTLVAGQTLTIAGVVYTVAAAENIATGNFLLSTGGTAAQNIENTSRSLCRVINGYRANTRVWAWYESEYDGAPGTILIEERHVGGSSFTAAASNAATGNAFSPPLPPGTGAPTAITSEADRGSGRVRVSKQGEPEACPLYRDLLIGSEDDQVLRILPLRDSVIVIKSRSVWRITGSAFEDLLAERIDDTIRCVSRESAAKVNNSVIFLSNQGFVSVAEDGIQNLSLVDRDRHALLAKLAESTPAHVFAATNERQRLYLCVVPQMDLNASLSTRDRNTIMCWNVDGGCWSRWAIRCDRLGNDGAQIGCIGSKRDLLFVGAADGYTPILRQRDVSVFGVTEFAECQVELSFTWGAVVSGRQRITTPTESTTNYPYLAQLANTHWGYAVSIGGAAYVISRDDDGYYVTNGDGNEAGAGVPSNPATVTAYCSIPTMLQVMTAMGSPGDLKQFTDVIVSVAETQMHDLEAEFVGSLAVDYRVAPSDYAFSSSQTYGGGAQTRAYPYNFYQGTNDGAMSKGKTYDLRQLRLFVDKQRQTGEWLGVRLYQNNAWCRLAYKAITVVVRTLNSARVRQ